MQFHLDISALSSNCVAPSSSVDKIICYLYKQVTDIMINDPITKAELDVNSVNHKGLTALDILEQFQSETGDIEIERTLLEAGAMRAKDNNVISTSQSPEIIINQVPPATENPTAEPRSRYEELTIFFRCKRGQEKESDVRTALLTVAVLMATATYQAGLSPPGGVWQDDHLHRNDTLIAPAGASVMGTRNKYVFYAFILFNSLGFYTSLYVIWFVTYGAPLGPEFQATVIAITATSTTSMDTIVPGGLGIVFSIIFLALPILIPVLSYILQSRRR